MWFVNIETLNTATPDLSTITVDKYLDSTAWGPAMSISHHIYDPTGQYIMVTLYGIGPAAGDDGALLFLNADTNLVEKQIPMPPRAHSLAYPGFNR
ncbi:MAG: hypothetical protein C4534_02225 [Gaiellales bacterium]|nr:MAG: hypothetical protein C4534_02225 [Gaiellales bacterium]